MNAARLLPGLADLRRYERAWLRHDLLAGLTVAAYLIPQVMGGGRFRCATSTPGSSTRG
jgi:MFS superfamily sulfate permease-like transporter